MNKFDILIVLVMALLTFAHASHKHYLYKDYDNSLLVKKLKGGSTWEDKHKINFQFDMCDNLETLEASTVICFETEPDYKVCEGAKAFAIQVWCGLSECTRNTDLGTVFIASYAKDTYPLTWAAGGYDLSNHNDGITLEAGPGTEPNFLYNLSQKDFWKSNLPGSYHDAYLKCYANFGGDFYDAYLVGDVVIGSDWEEYNVHWDN